MTKNIIVGVLVLLFSLISAYIFIIYSVYSVFTANHEVISIDILGEDYLYESESWFAYKYFLKFNPPIGGKHYYISNFDGIIERAKEEIVAVAEYEDGNYDSDEDDSDEDNSDEDDSDEDDSDVDDYEYEETNTTEVSNLFFKSDRSFDESTDTNNSEVDREPDDENDDFTLQKTYSQYTEKPISFSSNSPYISFVSLSYRLYDIYFEINGTPYIKENINITEDSIPTYFLIRHRLHSFVGPNKNIYSISYNNDNVSDIAIRETNPVQYLDHFQIKTFGPYCKWEHTYKFSPNGLHVTIISPVKIVPNRWIPLLGVYPNNEIMDRTFLIFSTPSGKKYVVMNDLNIVLFYDDEGVEPSPFISYIGPNSAIYNIYFRIDEQGYHSSIENFGTVEGYYGTSRLLSFVGPNKKLYRINHTYKNVTDIPLLVAEPDDQTHTNLKINVSMPDDRNKYYNKHVTYTFDDNGKHLIDREDEFDWTPLYEQPDFDIEEVDADNEVVITSFLSFYSPSGKNYHITTTNESEPNIVIEKGHQNNRSSYIKFIDSKGRTNLIYISPQDDPFITIEKGDAPTLNHSSPHEGEDDSFGRNSHRINNPFFKLLSFATPYKKFYFVDNIHDKLVIRTPQRQPIDPLDENPINCLTISIRSRHQTNIFEFSWSGDKFLNVHIIPTAQMTIPRLHKLAQSLIGGGRLDEKYLKQQRREWYKKKSPTKN